MGEKPGDSAGDEPDVPSEGGGPSTTRRGFLQGVGAAGAATLGVPGTAAAAVPPLKTSGATQTTTVCPFCGVGCGQIAYTKGGELIHVEGDPSHPVSEGTLCSKGAALSQVTNNPRRLDKVLYRPPGGGAFEERSWEWAFAEIAKRLQKTRDQTFQQQAHGRTVNRTEQIACLGGAALDNEECYLLVKAMRSFGITYIEHQARI
jgi:formate dehydrogenase major subunit